MLNPFLPITEVFIKRFFLLTITFLFLFGCASSTYIQSRPPGANLYINGQPQGETPGYYTDKAVAGTVRVVTLKKEGYKEFTGTIRREKLSIPVLIGGIFLIVPFFWILEYPGTYQFEMEKL